MPPYLSPTMITPSEKNVKKRVLKKILPPFKETCNRNGISVRADVMLVTSLLEDINMLTQENRQEVVDPSKVFREQRATRLNETVGVLLTETICFDGKRDTTLKINRKVVSKSHKRKVNEDTISIVVDPGSNYAGHITLQTRRAKSISAGLINFFKNTGDNLNNSITVG